MSPDNWPPGQESATGVGLVWNKQTALLLLDKDALLKPESLPTVKLSSVPVPADTLLLTELIAPDNVLGGNQRTTVFSPSQQQRFLKDSGAYFHHDRFNYLMVDGHVELLSPLQTGSIDGHRGIWTIKKGN